MFSGHKKSPARQRTALKWLLCPVRDRIQIVLFPAVMQVFSRPCEIICRRRPGDIVVYTEHRNPEPVAGTVDADSVPKQMRFPVRDIFPGGKVWIKGLFLHGFPVSLFFPNHVNRKFVRHEKTRASIVLQNDAPECVLSYPACKMFLS